MFTKQMMNKECFWSGLRSLWNQRAEGCFVFSSFVRKKDTYFIGYATCVSRLSSVSATFSLVVAVREWWSSWWIKAQYPFLRQWWLPVRLSLWSIVIEVVPTRPEHVHYNWSACIRHWFRRASWLWNALHIRLNIVVICIMLARQFLLELSEEAEIWWCQISWICEDVPVSLSWKHICAQLLWCDSTPIVIIPQSVALAVVGIIVAVKGLTMLEGPW